MPFSRQSLLVGILLSTATPLKDQIQSTAQVTLAGGSHAGSYTVESPTPCDIRPARDGYPAEFRADVASDSAIRALLTYEPRRLTRIEIRVPDIAPSQRGVFHLSVIFGDPANRRKPGTRYVIDTTPVDGGDSMLAQHLGQPLRKSSGRGIATIGKQGKITSLTFSGQTDQGVRLDGAIECRKNVWD